MVVIIYMSSDEIVLYMPYICALYLYIHMYIDRYIMCVYVHTNYIFKCKYIFILYIHILHVYYRLKLCIILVCFRVRQIWYSIVFPTSELCNFRLFI